MKSVQILSVFGLVAAANAFNQMPRQVNYNATVTTEVVTAITTFCPEATTIVQNGVTYTATASETLTITDCPCTLTKPVAKPTTVPVVAAPTGGIPPVVGNVSYVTTSVTAYTTVCPAATTLVQGNQTYTATASQTLTITNCPCTVSYPVSSVSTSYLTTYCPSSTTVVVGSSTYSLTSGTTTIPVETTVAGTPPTPAVVAVGSTTAAVGSTTAPSAAATTTGPIQANNGAKVGSGLGALAVAGLAMVL
ncbi:Cell wall protein [Lachnellula hyalina]|uniref:Cell wall protein n=1 Tax=Lachnellula hyalina TaxID=1316788 RepID=A0A8H8U1E8_9HELO|nr:Cell wall protein [Lachnellula hyalina]TVY27862.1 Cell wall protein [Lachnellula hyalina]